MSVVRPAGVKVLVHFHWLVLNGELTPEIIERLVPYLTRYGETMNLRVLTVGGVADHLHLLIDIPTTTTLEKVSRELQKPSERFVRDGLGHKGFTWDAEHVALCSVSPWDADHVIAYINEQETRHTTGDLDPTLEVTPPDEPPHDHDDTLPDWLNEVLKTS